MPLTVLFAARAARWPEYEPHLRAAFAAEGVEAGITPEADPADVDYIIYAPDSPLTDFTPYTRAKAVLNIWAGVEGIVGNPTLKIPLARMSESGLRQGMVEWVCGHVLRHHLELDRDIVNPDHRWEFRVPPLAGERRVTVLGLGALGAAAAQALAGLGFDVAGWSRRPKDLAGITCLAGPETLEAALARADILVLLLPLTPATGNILDAARLAQVPRGAVILNPGRGGLIDDDALLAALDSGQVGHATLDVFRTEPLPAGHPFWAHPRVTVTPHIASATRADTAARSIARNIARAERGEPLLNLVDRGAGY